MSDLSFSKVLYVIYIVFLHFQFRFTNETDENDVKNLTWHIVCNMELLSNGHRINTHRDEMSECWAEVMKILQRYVRMKI
jgi:hypothetical protein